MNQIFDPREFAEMARFYQEVRQARLMGGRGGGRPLQEVRSPNRGASRVLTPPIVDQPFQFLTILEAKTDNKDAEAMTLTINVVPENFSFNFQPNLLSGAGGVAGGGNQFFPLNTTSIIGHLVWGTGEANFEAFFDLMRGVTIPINASFVRLDAAISFQVMPVGDPPLNWRVNASLGYHSLGTPGIASPLRLTQFFGLGVSGGGADVGFLAIPPWANSFAVQADAADPNLPNIEIQVRGTGAVPLPTRFRYINQTNTSNHVENTFPIWNGAQEIVVDNNDLANAVSGKVIYNLCL